MEYDYRQSHTTAGKGEAYDNDFSDNAHRSLIWELEKRCLDRIVKRYYQGREISLLDFACGTGRILAYLEDRVGSATGMDISEEMLNRARDLVKSAELIEGDITRDDVLGGRVFNLITAFRFFPNAQGELRSEVITALVKHLSDDGYLVFNNHMNMDSVLYKLLRLTKRAGTKGMYPAEADAMVRSVGMKIVKVFPIGLLPATENHLFLPRPILRLIEIAACKRPCFKTLSQDLIFVCQRA